MSSPLIEPYRETKKEWEKSGSEVQVIAVLSSRDTMNTINSVETMGTVETIDTTSTPLSSSVESTSTEGDSYISPVTYGNARQINGSVGTRDQSLKKKTYYNPQASGDSRQVNGDVSGDVGLQFFN